MIGDDVLAYYESGVELDRLERPSGRLELMRTQELLERFLPPGCAVLDVGGGTGLYAQWLVERGHAVTLVDPVPLHVEEARKQAGQPPRFSVEQGDARDLPVANDSFDSVIVLGPLYHLGERADRMQALREARRVCRRGGIVLAAAISRFAPLLDIVRRGLLSDPVIAANVRDEASSGRRVPPERRSSPFPDAYFHTPEELADELGEAGLVPDGVYGIEGPASILGNEELARHLDDLALRDEVLAVARVAEQALAGVSPHLLAVGRA